MGNVFTNEAKGKGLGSGKRQQERNVVLEEFRKTGGYGGSFSG